MENLKTKLKIGLMEPEKSVEELVEIYFYSQKETVESVEIVEDKNKLFKRIDEGAINALVINIFSYGIAKGIEIIEEIRKRGKEREKEMPVCILGSSEQLKYFKEVPNEWKSSFKRYCRVAIDGSLPDLNEEIKRMSLSMFRYRKEKILENQRNDILKSVNLSDEEKMQKITALFNEAIKLSSEQGKDANIEPIKNLIPGVSEEALPVVMQKTLEGADKSINTFKKANLAIIIFGILFISASFVGFWIENNLAFLGLGGLGLAGVIASLLTAPVASIGKTARQMVHIQLCYFSYFKQIEMLGSNASNVFEKSKRLEEVANSLQESLCKHFDDSNNHKQSEKKGEETAQEESN